MRTALLIITLSMFATTAMAAELRKDIRVGATWSVNPAGGQWLGLHGFYVGPSKTGFFLEFRSGPLYYMRDDYYDNISTSLADSWNDDIQKAVESNASFNAGGVIQVAPRMMLYAGIGYGYTEKFEKRYDSFHILGSDGEYYIDAGTESGINLTGGATAIIGPQLAMQLGFDTRPTGVTLGIGVSWPRIEPADGP